MFGNRLTDFYLSSAQITQQQLAIGLSLLRGRIPWQRRGRGRVLFAIPGTHAYRSTHISRISIRSTWVANVLSFLCSLIVLAIHIHWLSAFLPFAFPIYWHFSIFFSFVYRVIVCPFLCSIPLFLQVFSWDHWTSVEDRLSSMAVYN